MSREHTGHSAALLEFSITLPQAGQSGRGGRAPRKACSPATRPPRKGAAPWPAAPPGKTLSAHPAHLTLDSFDLMSQRPFMARTSRDPPEAPTMPHCQVRPPCPPLAPCSAGVKPQDLAAGGLGFEFLLHSLLARDRESATLQL